METQISRNCAQETRERLTITEIYRDYDANYTGSRNLRFKTSTAKHSFCDSKTSVERNVCRSDIEKDSQQRPIRVAKRRYSGKRARGRERE